MTKRLYDKLILRIPVPGRILVGMLSACLVMLIGLVVLTGWLFDIDYFKAVLPRFPQMKPNTALGLFVSGVGLLCVLFQTRSSATKAGAKICGLLVFLLGALTLSEYVFGTDSGFDGIFIWIFSLSVDAGMPQRMSPHAALNFLLFGLSLFVMTGRRRTQRFAELPTLAGVFVALAAFLGHLYGAQQFYGSTRFGSMAVHTIFSFAVLATGLLAANREGPIAAILVSKDLGGHTARRLLPALIIIMSTIAALRMAGQNRGYYDMGFGAALAAFAGILSVCSVVLIYSLRLDKADRARKHFATEMARNEQRYRDLFDYSQGLICIHDIEGVLTTVNPAVLTALGYSREEMVGRPLLEFLHEEHRAVHPTFLRTIANEGLASDLFPIVSKNGRTLMWSYQSILVTEEGEEPYVIGHAQDVTEMLAAQRQLKNLTLTDDLTGLYNRRGFMTLAEQQIKLERHERTARGLTLMFADMDGLKAINDIHGHEAGSEAIVQFGKILSSALREADLIARWGGDEFVMLTIGSHHDNVEGMKERLLEKIAEYNRTSGKPYSIECSVGVAPIPLDGERSFESIIAEADEAMYAEKRRRKAERPNTAFVPNLVSNSAANPLDRFVNH